MCNGLHTWPGTRPRAGGDIFAGGSSILTITHVLGCGANARLCRPSVTTWHVLCIANGAALIHDRIFTEYGNIRVLQGRARILPWAPALESLAARCGQHGACHWLHFFLNGATARFKHPMLVLQAQAGFDPGCLTPENVDASQLRAAVLLSEYRPAGLRTHIVTTDDEGGWRSVVAMPADRRQAAAHALRAALSMGAHLAVATIDVSSPATTPSPPAQLPLRAATRSRAVSMRLPLAPTLEDTLATMGRSTRVNMRYYRRKLESEHDIEFVAEPLQHIALDEIARFQRASRYPSAPREFLRRIEACQDRGGYISGLRVRGGPWLSFAGGWRQDRTSVLYMQINSPDWGKASLSMVMRSFLIEDEIRRGSDELLFFGGTPHSIHHAFTVNTVEDLLVRRESGLAELLVRTLPLARSRISPVGRSNFLAGMLCDPHLTWHAPGATQAPASRRHLARQPLV